MNKTIFSDLYGQFIAEIYEKKTNISIVNSNNTKVVSLYHGIILVYFSKTSKVFHMLFIHLIPGFEISLHHSLVNLTIPTINDHHRNALKCNCRERNN